MMFDIRKETLEFLYKLKAGIDEDIMIVKDLEEEKIHNYMLKQSNVGSSKGAKKIFPSIGDTNGEN